MADQVLQDIKDRLNIADVIGGYIQLKKAGTNFKALCPFHHEKTPSLQVSPQKQIWHCFGCGEGGDVFGFVMKYENLEFKDALKILADKAGINLPVYRGENKEQQDEKDLLLRINDFAARFYHEILIKDSRGKAALEYLKNRGLTDGTIKLWQIGYAPDDFHSLEQALAQKKVDIADSIKAGVTAKNERGQVYDRFRGRVTFPIFNYFGDIVGFSARILIDDGKSALNHSLRSGTGQAKYINSPETAIYNKSKAIFGLNFAKDSIRKSDEAVIVEGQMDCISAHQAGFKNTVATSGTALNEASLTQLGRLTKNLKFCFDADSAGLAASRRAGELALRNGFRLKVIVLTEVKDPDELIKKSPGLWEKAVSEAVWFLDYYINIAQAKFPPDSVEQKHYLSEQVVPFLGFVADPLEQDHYIHQLVSKFFISEQVIRQQIKPGPQAAIPDVQPLKITQNYLLEKEVLGGLLKIPDFLNQIKDRLKVEDFEQPESREVAAAVLAGQTPDGVLAKEVSFMVESQLDELGGNQTALLRQLLKAFALLKITQIKQRQNSLQTEIKHAEIAKNKQQVQALNQEFAQISLERTNFEALL